MEVEEKETLPLKSRQKVLYNGAIEMPKNGCIDKYESVKDIEDPENKLEKKESKEDSPMSVLRKICFFFSLNILALYFLVFAWLLPCRIKPEKQPAGLISNGSLFFQDIEITSNIDLMLSSKVCCPLIFGYKRSNESNAFGIASINITTGDIIWQTPAVYRTTYINCELADVFQDNVTDCFAVSRGNYIGLFSGSSGTISWISPGVVTANRGTPVLLPGCDSSSTSTLLIPSADLNIQKNIYASMIALPSGEKIRSPMELPMCDKNPQVMLWKNSLGQTDLLFLCQEGDYSVLYKISFDDFCELVHSTAKYMKMTAILNKENSKGDAVMKSVSFLNANQHDLLLAFSGSVIYLLDGITLKLKWKHELPSDENLKDVNYGFFKDHDFPELVIFSEVSSGIQISFIDRRREKISEYTTMVPVTGSLLASKILSGFNNETDAILIQMITGNGSSSNCTIHQSLSNMNLDKEPQKFGNYSRKSCYEKFILVDVTNNTFITVLEQDMPFAGTAVVQYIDDIPVLISAGIAAATNSSTDTSIGTRIELRSLRNPSHNSSCNCNFAAFGQKTINSSIMSLKHQILATRVNIVQKLFAEVSMVY